MWKVESAFQIIIIVTLFLLGIFLFLYVPHISRRFTALKKFETDARAKYEHPSFIFEKQNRLLLSASLPPQYVNSSKFLLSPTTSRPEKFDVIIMVGPKIGARKIEIAYLYRKIIFFPLPLVTLVLHYILRYKCFSKQCSKVSIWIQENLRIISGKLLRFTSIFR